MWQLFTTHSFFTTGLDFAYHGYITEMGSEFGDTQVVIKELKETEYCDELLITEKELDALWERCRAAPVNYHQAPAELLIANTEMLHPDDYEGTVDIHINCRFIPTERPKPAKDKSEQLSLF